MARLTDWDLAQWLLWYEWRSEAQGEAMKEPEPQKLDAAQSAKLLKGMFGIKDDK